MKWRNYAALLEIGASPIEVDAPPSHSLFVSSSCFTLLINKRIFFHLSTTLYPTDRLTSSASLASSRFLSLARVGLYFEVSTKILGSRTRAATIVHHTENEHTRNLQRSLCLSTAANAPHEAISLTQTFNRII